MNFLTQILNKELASKSNKNKFKLSQRVAFISAFLGSFALIVAFAVLDGYDYYLRNNSAKFTSHIKVENLSKLNGNALEYIYPKVSNLVKGKSYLVKQSESILRYKDFTDGILIKSYGNKIAPILEQNNLTVPKKNEIIISKMLAKRIGVIIGDQLVVYVPLKSSSSRPEIIPIKVRVANLYQTGMVQYDNNVVFAIDSTIDAVQVQDYSAIEIYLPHLDNLEIYKDLLKSNFKLPFYVLGYDDIHRGMFTWIEIQKKPIPIVLGIISLVAIMNILTSLIIVVTEKTKSIAIFQTMGIMRSQIYRVFIFQGLKLGMSGGLLGCLIGFILLTLQKEFSLIKLPSDIYFLEALPVKIYFWHYAVVITFNLLLSIISTLLPAYFATKVKTISALKFNN